ncbi:SDR family NAD(P)-dependent oxidoreductase [Mycolicibacterium brisbanense]|uniref:Oxidoreductase, short-chain dehydrogenase/reductase family n=1 Tax=Mycolicibacterium brisbanense TaxID=146020 RepID=A0A117I597_9MYCO|nr:SDR family NAD(P)-dependent oxidoreductase [Mycolicibacterium brisbanense]MCV7157761.1 SDR family NAD(P)-dependent oxidoreductase [Mycolicibacterium brisbanense]GAS88005.1 oxidoreductase, short-chain dehydrogenase/reductase family [Mycolicibacterium brisbanense]
MKPLHRVAGALIPRTGAINKALATPTSRTTPRGLLQLIQRRGSLSEALRGRVVMITGASSGIGEATALAVGRAGGTVLLVARSADKLVAIAEAITAAGGIAAAYPCDLADPDAVDRLVAQVLDEHGRVDILVNNAGRSIRRSLALSYGRIHDFERTMQLNYFAPLRLMLGLLPQMRANRFGQVINVSSAGVQTRAPRFGAYIASKAALDTVSDAFQAETLDEGVRFTTVHMSLVRTPMIAPTKLYDKFPALTPQEAAQVITRAMIERPRRVSPVFGRVASFADSLSPELMDAVRNRGFKMFGDSGAAKSEPAELTGSQTVFIDATPGVHW